MIDFLITIIVCLWLLTSCIKWPVCVENDGQKHCFSIYDSSEKGKK